MDRFIEKDLMRKITTAIELLKDSQEILSEQVNGKCAICTKPGMCCGECESCDNANNNIQDAIDKIQSSFSLSGLDLDD